MHTLDAGAREFVQWIASPALTGIMRGATWLGEWLPLAIVTSAAIALLWRAGRRRAALAIAVIVGGAEVIDQALKVMVHRARPTPFFGTPLPASYSFPSGHAMVSWCLLGGLAAVLSGRLTRTALRIALWAAAAVLAGAIGFSRVYLGVHYASDVLGGYVVGSLWMFVVLRGRRE